MKIVRSPSRFLCEVCSSSRSTNQLIYPFYCFKGSFDRFELTFRTFEDVFHCSVIKVRSVFSEAVPASAATLIVYHKVLCLSRTFFYFYRLLFILLIWDVPCRFFSVRQISFSSELLYPITAIFFCQACFFHFFHFFLTIQQYYCRQAFRAFRWVPCAARTQQIQIPEHPTGSLHAETNFRRSPATSIVSYCAHAFPDIPPQTLPE